MAQITGTDNGDFLYDTAASDTIDGLGGNDNISAGQAQRDSGDTVLGGDGDDLISFNGFATQNVVDAGAGNDTIQIGSPLGLRITLGAGADTVVLQSNFAPNPDGIVVTDYAPGTDRMNLNLERLLSVWDGNNPFAGGYLRVIASGADTLVQMDRDGGGNGFVTALRLQGVSPGALGAADFLGFSPNGSMPSGQVLSGTGVAEALVGGAGADTITGGGGNDTLSGGAGGDSITGGNDADFIEGGAGNDTIRGGGGNDGIFDGLGADQIFGEDGDDTIVLTLLGAVGRTLVDGGAGNDRISSGNGGDAPNQAVTLLGGDGNDTITLNGFAESNVVDAGAGDDEVQLGSARVSTITLGSGADKLIVMSNFGGIGDTITDYVPGVDQLTFPFSQLLSGWNGSDNPFGSGFARLVANGADTLFQVDFDGGANSYVTVFRFQNTTPGAFTLNDFSGFPPDGSPVPGQLITGTDGNDTLTGTLGGDTINGGLGNDSINGQAGNDVINGGAGTDNLTGGVGDDTIHGGDDDDFIGDGQGGDQLFGDGGNDRITVTLLGGGRILVDGGAGNDAISVSNGGPFSNQPATILGGEGNDTLSLNGFAENNTVDAGTGDDRVEIGSMRGAQITLGAGIDTVVLQGNIGPTTGRLVVTDFTAGTDRLDLNLEGFLPAWDKTGDPFARGYVRLIDVDGGMLIQRDSNGGGDNFATVLELRGVSAASLSPSDTGGFDPRLSANEASIGTAGADSVSFAGMAAWSVYSGLGGDDTLVGGDGRDSLYGGAGNDVIDGGNNSDLLVGGSGADLFVYNSASGDVIGDFTPGVDRIVMSAYSNGFGIDEFETLALLLVQKPEGTYVDLSARGNLTDEAILLLGVNAAQLTERDFILNPATDVRDYDTTASSFNLKLIGQAGNDRIVTGSGADVLIGGAGHDLLDGGAGADSLYGGSGSDTLRGGAGNDVLIGGSGGDLAIYTAARSAATVVRNADGTLTVTTAADGTDLLTGVEFLQFGDGLAASWHRTAGAPVVANFNPANGWTSQDQYPRHVADVNGDGYADIVGFGTAGVVVSFGSAGGSFTGAALMLADYGQASGWATDNGFHRELADVNGDGRADILGFGFAGTLVSLANADGTFATVKTGITDFGVNQGWANQNGFARTVGDVNGDGKADLVGFGFAGALVALGNGNGTFQPVKTAIANFGVNQGWISDNTFHRALADVSGDGRADIVGFGIAGTYVALANADGTFGNANLVLADFGANQGWSSNDSFSRLVVDVNGDLVADIVGFGIAGTLVAFGKGDGTFTQAGFDVSDFGKNQGWSSDNTFHREVADINNDGFADIVGFGIAGVLAGINQGDFLI